MMRTIKDVQQDFAISSGLRSEIIWDSLAADQSDILKQKIAALVPEGNAARTAKIRADLFQSVWLQRKYTNRNLLSSIIYVTVTEAPDLPKALLAEQFSCHPVFRTRKCTKNDGSSTGCCMIFIDEHGRIYRNWQEYVDNNVLPMGMMIAPVDGVYMLDGNGQVRLTHTLTPQARPKSRLLTTTDRVATAGNAAISVPLLASLVTTVAPPVMVTAVAVSLSASAYTTVRSMLRLKDRRRHGQSTGLTDGEARTEWLGVAAGVAGIGSVGATQALTMAASIGREVSLGTQLMVQGINVSSILLSGTGVAHGVYELYMKYNDDVPISSLDVLCLASSLVVFTHSLNNLRLASKVTDSGKGSTFRRQVSKEIRNTLDKLCRETNRLHPTATRKFDVLRLVNDIPLKEVLMQLPQLNGHLPGQLLSLANVVSALPAGLLRLTDDNGIAVNLAELALQYGVKFVQHIGNMSSLNDVLNALASYLSPDAVDLLMRFTQIFIDISLDTIDYTLKTFISTEVVLYKVLMYCVRHYTNFSFEFLESKTLEVLADLEAYFLSLSPKDETNMRYKCDQCDGHYTECRL